ncbi:MAG: hypothetical protein O2894_12800 [Planctomycetota bacterium]|nr:hypothetical protein [Planctomycetota bacterium]
MRSLRTNSSTGSQLGGTNWAFIISLIVALVFIWLWFQETDKQERNAAAIAAAEKRVSDLNDEGIKLADALVELSNAVGWKSSSMNLSHIRRTETSLSLTDVAAVKGNFDPEGVVKGAEEGATTDGVLKRIIAAAQLTFEREARLHTTATGAEKEYKYETLSTAFKDKLKEITAKWGDVQFSRPVSPADPDDAQGQANYQSELVEWENKVKEYSEDYKALALMEGWKEYSAVIAAPGQVPDLTKTPVTVQFYQYADGGVRTVEAGLVGLDTAFTRMGDELRANMQTWGEEIAQLRMDTAAKDVSIGELNTQLTAAQEAHNNDVTQLQDRLNQETERANRNAIQATNAQNEVLRVKDDTSKTVASLSREVEARKEQNRLLKEKRDLVIARDDVDGSVLVSNTVLGTAMIDLGTKDKAYVGQKFVVSQNDRAGNRVNKGEIMIVKVTGDHSAKARILSGSAGRGDLLHNPFYEAGERVYVYFAAKLDKWPKAMATERLAQLNVVVQDAPDGNTHYIIVPNSWTAPVETVGGEDDEGDEEGAATGSNPLEEMKKTARTFGANVITEALLDAFLDY